MFTIILSIYKSNTSILLCSTFIIKPYGESIDVLPDTYTLEQDPNNLIYVEDIVNVEDILDSEDIIENEYITDERDIETIKSFTIYIFMLVITIKLLTLQTIEVSLVQNYTELNYLYS